MLAGFHPGTLAHDGGLLAGALVGFGVLACGYQVGHLRPLLFGIEFRQGFGMGKGDLSGLDGILHDLGAIQQGQRVAYRGDAAVVDDGNLVFTFSQCQVPAHLLCAAERTVGRAGLVLAGYGIQSRLPFAGVHNRRNLSFGFAAVAPPFVGESGRLDALAPEYHLGFARLGVLGDCDGFQHALVVDIAGQRFVHRQMYTRVVERAIFVGDEGQFGGVEVEQVALAFCAVNVFRFFLPWTIPIEVSGQKGGGGPAGGAADTVGWLGYDSRQISWEGRN